MPSANNGGKEMSPSAESNRRRPGILSLVPSRRWLFLCRYFAIDAK